MTATTLAGTAAPPSRAAAWRRRVGAALAWRPEWPAVVVALAAWTTLVVLELSGPGGAFGLRDTAGSGADGTGGTGGAAHAVLGHVHDPTSTVSATGQPSAQAALLALLGWALMTTSMMTPVALPALRHVALNSLAERRLRAMAVHLVGYLAVWTVFGILPLALVSGARAAGAGTAALATALLVGAAGWQLTRWKRRALLGCRRTVPLPPLGWRADRACLRFGALQGRACVLTCGPLMSTMLVADRAAVPTMAALTAVVLAERGTRIRGRLIRPIAAALALAAVAIPMAAAFGPS